MATTLEAIRCNFIGEFKTGDNMVANSKSLCRLSETNDGGIFNKLMVVQAGSLVEAALDQIIYRAQNHTTEGVPNIGDEEMEKIRGTKIERFYKIINAMQTHKLLDGLGEDIYQELHRLRELRNRIHIQFDDAPKDLGRDDHQAFNNKTLGWALGLCIKIFRHLSERFPRPETLKAYAHDVSIPTG